MKKIIALSLVLVLAFACVLASCTKGGNKLDSSALDDLIVDKDAETENGDMYSFELVDNETVVITEYKGSHELHEVVVPTKLVVDAKPDGYTVVGIDAKAFYYDVSITKITIPEGVTYIGDYAFAGCSSLKSIVLPSTLTSVGNYAFYACNALEGIDLPVTVETIGDGAFTDCTALKTVGFPTALKTIGKGAFRKCVALEEVTIKSTALESIGVEAFYDCAALKEVLLPSAVKEKLGSNAFTNCHDELGVWYE
jgi:hypothetical protein